ncbi:hypothetical protein EV361DRAFT_930983 [Lentinula raphanica]|nr:hypothetical protein EV361DRAFT_930983 [Lentinula raphanica]
MRVATCRASLRHALYVLFSPAFCARRALLMTLFTAMNQDKPHVPWPECQLFNVSAPSTKHMQHYRRVSSLDLSAGESSTSRNMTTEWLKAHEPHTTRPSGCRWIFGV